MHFPKSIDVAKFLVRWIFYSMVARAGIAEGSPFIYPFLWTFRFTSSVCAPQISIILAFLCTGLVVGLYWWIVICGFELEISSFKTRLRLYEMEY